jgi:hypothetical protein
MSGQGKSLQDIYDAGSRRLEQSGQAQRLALQEAGIQGGNELSELESSMLSKMDSSLADLETEVSAYLSKAVEAINSSINAEVEENRKFLERLQETLKLTCRSLAEDVKHLRESLVQKFNASADQCQTLQRSETDRGVGQLKVDGFNSAVHLKELCGAGNAELNARAAGHVLQAFDRNTKLPSEFVSEFSKHAASIDKRINDCVQLLGSRSKEIVADLSAGNQTMQTTMNEVVEQLAARLEEVYKESDARLTRHCEDALSAALKHQEELSRKLSGNLVESDDLSSAGVAQKLQFLRTSTNNLLDQVKQLLVDVDGGIRKECETLSEAYTGSLTKQLEDAREHNKVVADERGQLMERIAAELHDIETNFESRLSELAQKCQARLSTACVDAEMAIVSAHDTCAAEFKSLSAQRQKTIEEKTQQLLADIEKMSQQAVLSIKTAAGEIAAAPGQTQPSSQSLELELSDDLSNPFGDFGDLKL